LRGVQEESEPGGPWFHREKKRSSLRRSTQELNSKRASGWKKNSNGSKGGGKSWNSLFRKRPRAQAWGRTASSSQGKRKHLVEGVDRWRWGTGNLRNGSREKKAAGLSVKDGPEKKLYSPGERVTHNLMIRRSRIEINGYFLSQRGRLVGLFYSRHASKTWGTSSHTTRVVRKGRGS